MEKYEKLHIKRGVILLAKLSLIVCERARLNSATISMAAFSKYFRITARDLACNELSHEGGTCLESIVENFTRTIPGCIKFVLPLALVRATHKSHTHTHVTNGQNSNLNGVSSLDSGHHESEKTRPVRFCPKLEDIRGLFLWCVDH